MVGSLMLDNTNDFIHLAAGLNCGGSSKRCKSSFSKQTDEITYENGWKEKNIPWQMKSLILISYIGYLQLNYWFIKEGSGGNKWRNDLSE